MKDWLEITKKLTLFGYNLKFFGGAILHLATIISIVFFWFIVMSYYIPYREISLLMIRFIQIGVQLFVIGFILYYLFYFINELIHKKQMSKVSVKIKRKKK